MSEIIMPKMGDAMTEGKVIRWYKKSGDSVKKGEPLLEIETDKVNLDLEAEEDGILGEVAVAEGEVAPVGARLAMIGDGSKSAAAPSKPAGTPAEKPAEKPKEEAKAEARPRPAKTEAVAAPAAKREGRLRSSPLARKMAETLGVDLSAVEGSGPNGRIVAADIEKAAKSGGGRVVAMPRPAAVPAPREAKPLRRPAAIESKEIPLTAMRRTIAKRLVESIGPVPHFYLTIDVDVTQLLALRAQLNEIEETKSSVNDFIVRAAALALLHHPNVNASFTGESIRQHGEVHIGVAVATTEGLITPVIRNADGKSVPEIAAEVKALADRAKNRKLKPDEYQGSTFTISNLGMFGVEEFTAIINPPNSAILAIGAASKQPVVVDNQIVVRDRMKVTMSCDHRVIDGAAGAQYLQTLRQYLEQPLRLVM